MVEAKTYDNSVVLWVKADRIEEDIAEELVRIIKDYSSQGFANFGLELGAVEFIDSRSLGLLAKIYSMKDKSCKIALINVNEFVHRILVLAKFDTLLPVLANEKQFLEFDI